MEDGEIAPLERQGTCVEANGDVDWIELEYIADAMESVALHVFSFGDELSGHH